MVNHGQPWSTMFSWPWSNHGLLRPWLNMVYMYLCFKKPWSTTFSWPWFPSTMFNHGLHVPLFCHPLVIMTMVSLFQETMVNHGLHVPLFLTCLEWGHKYKGHSMGLGQHSHLHVLHDIGERFWHLNLPLENESEYSSREMYDRINELKNILLVTFFLWEWNCRCLHDF